MVKLAQGPVNGFDREANRREAYSAQSIIEKVGGCVNDPRTSGRMQPGLVPIGEVSEAVNIWLTARAVLASAKKGSDCLSTNLG